MKLPASAFTIRVARLQAALSSLTCTVNPAGCGVVAGCATDRALRQYVLPPESGWGGSKASFLRPCSQSSVRRAGTCEAC